MMRFATLALSLAAGMVLAVRANAGESAPGRGYIDWRKSKPVVVNGAEFQAETETVWTAGGRGREGDRGQVPVDIRLRITNRSDKELLFPLFDTFIPIVIYSDGKEHVLAGERTKTSSVKGPLLLGPGQDYSIVRRAYLKWWDPGPELALDYYDGTGASAMAPKLGPGKYVLKFRYEVTKEYAVEIAKKAPGKTVWIGKATTEGVEFEVVVADPAKTLEGNWEVVGSGGKGKSALDGFVPGAKITINGDKMVVTDPKGTSKSEYRIKLYPDKTPMAIDIIPLVGGEAVTAIYRLTDKRTGLPWDAEIAMPNYETKDRPADFECDCEKKMGVVNLERAKDKKLPATMSPTWHKGAKPSAEDVEFTIARRFARTGDAVLLPVIITNQSNKPITINLLHGARAGTHLVTDLYASVTPMGERTVTECKSVYRYPPEEVDDKTVISPGRAISVELWMDWDGTGSVYSPPLVERSAKGGYKVRLLLVFDLGGAQQFVLSPETTVELCGK